MDNVIHYSMKHRFGAARHGARNGPELDATLAGGDLVADGLNTPKLRDVARIAGVSVITASRCISNPERVSEKTRAKVLKVAEELGYIPNRLASAMVSSRSMAVGVVLPTIANPIHSVLLEALAEVLEPFGYRTLLGTTGYRADKEYDVVRTLLAHKVDAIALAGKAQSAQTRKLLAAANVPVAEMFELYDDPLDINVGLSNREAGAALARFLIARGRHRFAFVLHSEIDDSRMTSRYDGFLATATDARIEPFHDSSKPGLLRESVVSAILSRMPDVDAIVCSGHQAAVTAICALRNQGIAVPAQIAVAGFGDSPASQWVQPALTTVSYPMSDIGTKSGQLLLARLRGEAIDNAQADLGFQIMERGST